MHWKRNVRLRLAMLLCVAGFTEKRTRQTADVSSQHWRNMKLSDNPTAKMMAKMGQLLACPVSVLMSADPSAVTSCPIPEWDWLEEYEDGKHPSWERFEQAHQHAQQQ